MLLLVTNNDNGPDSDEGLKTIMIMAMVIILMIMTVTKMTMTMINIQFGALTLVLFNASVYLVLEWYE